MATVRTARTMTAPASASVNWPSAFCRPQAPLVRVLHHLFCRGVKIWMNPPAAPSRMPTTAKTWVPKMFVREAAKEPADETADRQRDRKLNHRLGLDQVAERALGLAGSASVIAHRDPITPRRTSWRFGRQPGLPGCGKQLSCQHSYADQIRVAHLRSADSRRKRPSSPRAS